MSSRFYAGDQPLATGQRIDLPIEESRHLLKTMRARVGERLVVFGGGRQYAAELVNADGKLATVELRELVPGPPETCISMTFLVPWIKGGKTDFLVQKLTELGAARIVVFQARREVAKGDTSKIDRLARIALEACKQCERITVPQISAADSLKAAIDVAGVANENCYILHERENAQSLGQALAALPEIPGEIAFASGPEGGWHPDELRELDGPVKYVTMGPRILRAETAPLVAAAATLFYAGEF